MLEDAARELDKGLQELREIARGLHPAILSDRGLLRAVESLAERADGAGRDRGGRERLPEHVEATAYYIVAEALTNVAKHAGGRQRAVTVRRDGAVVRCEILDNGRGGADRRPAPASSACATAPRRPVERWPSSARRDRGRS